MEEMAPALATIGMFFIVGWIIKMTQAHRRQVKLTELQHSLQVKLLDKFTTTQEVTEYLQGDVGQRFLESATVERSSPYARILGSIQASLVLLTGGAAFLLLQGRIADADEAFVFLGTLGVALGVGFGLSAAVAYILSKTWGVINGGSTDRSLPERS